MSPWQRAWHQFRCYIAETLLDWALYATPRGSKEEKALAYALQGYISAIQQDTKL